MRRNRKTKVVVHRSAWDAYRANWPTAGQIGDHCTQFRYKANEATKRLVGVTSSLQCAGVNRHEVEDVRALRERSSDPLGLESCAATARDTAKRRQRIGGVGIQLRKDAIRTPTSL